MRRTLLVVYGLVLLLPGAALVAHAQPAAAPPPNPPPAASTPANPGPANPGVAPLFQKHDDFGLDCITCHDEKPAAKAVPTAICLTCHGSYQELADKSQDTGENNPHASHQGDLDCDSCHHVHKQSENFCSNCHQFDMDVP